MMKLSNLLIPIAFVFSLQTLSVAAASTETEDLFLTHTQFMSLTFGEQKSYVRTIRDIFVEMNNNNPHLAKEFSERAGLFAMLWAMQLPALNAAERLFDPESAIDFLLSNTKDYNQAIANLNASAASQAEKKRAEQQLEMSIRYMKLAVHYTRNSTRGIQDNAVRERILKEKIEPAILGLEKSKDKIKAINSKNENVLTWNATKANLNKGVLVERESVLVNSLVSYGDSLNSLRPLSMTPAVTIPVKAPAPIKPKPLATSSEAAPAPQVTIEEEDPRGDLLYRCMYAGFVIQSEPCRAPSELPEGWSFDGIDRETFVCKKGTVMCNPLVFGLDVSCDWNKAKNSDGNIDECISTSKPFCTPPGRYATTNCSKKSKGDSAIESTVYLLRKTENNQSAMLNFRKNFNQLCDPKLLAMNSFGKKKRSAAHKAAIRRDIAATCAVAKKRLIALKDKYNLIKEATQGPPVPEPIAPVEQQGRQ